MKKLIFVSICLFITLASYSQSKSVAGDWKGSLSVQGTELPLIFHIKMEDGKYTATMDSPKQNAFGFKFDEVSFKEDTLTMKINQFQGNYEGKLKDGKLIGKWTQGPNSLDLNLTKTPEKK